MVPEYHPYALPYNTKPGLYKLGHDFGNGEYDNTTFQKDDNLGKYVVEKSFIKHNAINIDYNYIPEINKVYNYVLEQTPYAKYFHSRIQDDYTIHKVNNDTDRVIYTNVSLPSLWRPEEAIGKSLDYFHEPVPDIVLPKKLINSLVNEKFVRFVWSIYYNNRLNQHPDLGVDEFNPDNPVWHVRVERQVTIGFPDINCFLFVIKPYIVKKPRIPELLNTILGMSDEQKKYKRINSEFEGYLERL